MSHSTTYDSSRRELDIRSPGLHRAASLWLIQGTGQAIATEVVGTANFGQKVDLKERLGEEEFVGEAQLPRRKCKVIMGCFCSRASE